jgi:hypothetical protein
MVVTASRGVLLLQAHVVLAVLPHMRVIRLSRACHERSLEVLALAFSLCYALRAQVAVRLAQVWQRLPHNLRPWVLGLVSFSGLLGSTLPGHCCLCRIHAIRRLSHVMDVGV